uniref:Uncharacterized protein n=1 Tax=Pararge aegeria TaxID=116150 RepID=S4PWA3_9NEOP
MTRTLENDSSMFFRELILCSACNLTVVRREHYFITIKLWKANIWKRFPYKSQPVSSGLYSILSSVRKI